MSYYTTTNVTIASSGTASGSADLLGQQLVAFSFGTLTGTAITFEGSVDGGATWRQFRDEGGNALSATVGDDGICVLDPAWGVVGGCLVRLVSGSSEAAARTISLLTKEL